MEKLVAYLRKFRDLNIRILVRLIFLVPFPSYHLISIRQASYDRLRVLLLSGRLASAVALARANSASNSKRRHEDISSVSMSMNLRPKQRQRPSAAGPVKSLRGGEGASTRRRADSSTVTRTTRNQNAPSQVTRKNASRIMTMTRSASTGEESTTDMFTTKSRYTHTSKGVQAQLRGARESARDAMISPPLTRSDSGAQTSGDIPTHPRPRVYSLNTATNSKMKASSSHKSKALLPLENFV